MGEGGGGERERGGGCLALGLMQPCQTAPCLFSATAACRSALANYERIVCSTQRLRAYDGHLCRTRADTLTKIKELADEYKRLINVRPLPRAATPTRRNT